MKNITELREALFDGKSRRTTGEARKRLRQLVAPMFKAKEEAFTDAIKLSPIVGSLATQHSVSTVPQLYQAIGNGTLGALVAGIVDIDHVRRAVWMPVECGYEDSASKSGYQLGRPRDLSSEMIDDMIAEIAGAAKPSTDDYYTGSKNLEFDGLTDMCQVITTLNVTHKIPYTISEQLLIERGVDKASVQAAIAVLRDDPDCPYLTDDPRVTYIASICDDKHKMDDVDDEPEAHPVETDNPISMPEASKAQLIDLTLAQASLPPIGELLERINKQAVNITNMTDTIEKLKRSASAIAMPTEIKASGEIPKGKAKPQKAWKVFGLSKRKELDFDVPVWEWEHDHPHVPKIDDSYVFRPAELLGILQAIVTNQRCYLHGHSGSGKTTGVEQVCARLNWPVMRLNFDSEITRMDIIGRDTLVQDGGTTVSKFVDGILPTAMSGPYTLICDEIDFVRPDVAYVMQRAFEGNGLVVTEDGGRVVTPHAAFRMFATGNTVGQGDEYGMYQGARPQSMAMLDRFTMWIKVEYMHENDRAALISAKFPHLHNTMVGKINKYVTEHIEAFTTSKVLQPITPRGFLSLAQNFTSMEPLYGDDSAAMEFAFKTTVLDRCTVQDRAVLNDIYQRVFG
tara:strand:+ start:165 stop:2039 length:1875 start_codon:yes stop_codon:yes gene_type:complete